MRLLYLMVVGALAEVVFFVGISRHGARAPIVLQPWDTATKWPNGQGELTAEGMRQQYFLGHYLRSKYIILEPLLPTIYNHTKLNVNSSNMNRTIISARALTTGLYPVETPTLVNLTSHMPFNNIVPAKATIDLNDIIPISTHRHFIDALLRPAEDCAEYAEHIRRKRDSKAVTAIFKHYYDVTSTVAEYLKISIKEAEHRTLDVLDSVHCNKFMNYNVPLVFDQQWVDRANLLYLEIMHYERYQPDFVGRFVGAELMNVILSKMNGKLTKTEPLNGIIYSAHDTTIMNLFSTMSIQILEQPPFASVLLFELHNIGGNYFVQILYNGNLKYLQVYTDMATFDQFHEFVKMRSFNDVSMACGGIADVTNPKMPKSQTDEIISLLLFDLIVMAVIIGGIYYLIKKIHK